MPADFSFFDLLVVLTLNYLELQHAGITTKLVAKPNKLQAHTYVQRPFLGALLNFFLSFVPDHLLEIQKSLEPVSED